MQVVGWMYFRFFDIQNYFCKISLCVPFCVPFCIPLASLWCPFGVPLASLWRPFSVPLASLWGPLTSELGFQNFLFWVLKELFRFGELYNAWNKKDGLIIFFLEKRCGAKKITYVQGLFLGEKKWENFVKLYLRGNVQESRNKLWLERTSSMFYPIIEGGGAGTSWGVLLASENEIVFRLRKVLLLSKKLLKKS